MATIKQIEANRRNARKSTGPRTSAGKSVTRLNALQHGLFAQDPIIPGEDPDQFQTLQSDYLTRFQPATPEERTLLTSIVRNAWLLDRLSAIETELWIREIERDASHRTPDHPLAEAFSGLAKRLALLQRRVDSAQRHFRRDLELLNKLQTARRKAVPQPEAAPSLGPDPQPLPSQSLTPPIGFVPPSPPDTPPYPGAA
jgi:hypothetical protein